MADNRSGGVSGVAAIAIAGLGIAAIVGLTALVIDRYEAAADAVSVLTVVVGPLAGVAAAAFGVKLSIDAKNETKDVKKTASDIADDIRNLGAEVGGLREMTDITAATATQLSQIEQRLRRISR